MHLTRVTGEDVIYVSLRSVLRLCSSSRIFFPPLQLINATAKSNNSIIIFFYNNIWYGVCNKLEMLIVYLENNPDM